MISSYKILIASDDEHEKVFAEIYYNNKFCTLISQEDGLDNLKLEFPGPDLDENIIVREISIAVFLKALEEASFLLKGNS